jgi:hypothetical protein
MEEMGVLHDTRAPRGVSTGAVVVVAASVRVSALHVEGSQRV